MSDTRVFVVRDMLEKLHKLNNLVGALCIVVDLPNEELDDVYYECGQILSEFQSYLEVQENAAQR